MPHVTLQEESLPTKVGKLSFQTIKKTQTCLLNNGQQWHVNGQQGEKVMTGKKKKYPKMDYQELMEKKQMVLNDSFKCIS